MPRPAPELDEHQPRFAVTAEAEPTRRQAGQGAFDDPALRPRAKRCGSGHRCATSLELAVPAVLGVIQRVRSMTQPMSPDEGSAQRALSRLAGGGRGAAAADRAVPAAEQRLIVSSRQASRSVGSSGCTSAGDAHPGSLDGRRPER
jgi:hypothetical protein